MIDKEVITVTLLLMETLTTKWFHLLPSKNPLASNPDSVFNFVTSNGSYEIDIIAIFRKTLAEKWKVYQFNF